MITCPKCGHENEDSAMNCTSCRINLQWALEYYDKEAQPREPELAPLSPRDEAMKEFLSGELWRHKRVITVGVIAVLLYGLLVVITGVTGASSYCLTETYRCPPDGVDLCESGRARLELVPVLLPAGLFAHVIEPLRGLGGGFSFSSALAIHIVNALFYFLIAVWFSGLVEWFRQSPRQRKKVSAIFLLCVFICAIPTFFVFLLAPYQWCFL